MKVQVLGEIEDDVRVLGKEDIGKQMWINKGMGVIC